MAITKIHAIKSTLGKALGYIENPDKTDGQMLVSSYNCEPQTASIDFEMTAVLAHKAQNLKRKRSTNLAYHLIQSFSPEDAVTPEQAHELGKKLAFEYTGGKYEYVVATHIDKGHIHNHIMLNAVSFYDYKKLRTVPYRTARQIRDISDRLCMEAHLSVIDDPQKIGQLYPENAGKKKSVSNRTEIRKRLNFCLERAMDYSQFLSMAKEMEITPTIRGKHISYLLEGAGRSVRDNSLSDTDTFTNPLRITSMMSCRVTSEILSIIILSFISRQSVAPYTASVGIISFLYCAGDFPISFLNTLLKYSGFSYPTISEISLML